MVSFFRSITAIPFKKQVSLAVTSFRFTAEIDSQTILRSTVFSSTKLHFLLMLKFCKVSFWKLIETHSLRSKLRLCIDGQRNRLIYFKGFPAAWRIDVRFALTIWSYFYLSPTLPISEDPGMCHFEWFLFDFFRDLVSLAGWACQNCFSKYFEFVCSMQLSIPGSETSDAPVSVKIWFSVTLR